MRIIATNAELSTPQETVLVEATPDEVRALAGTDPVVGLTFTPAAPAPAPAPLDISALNAVVAEAQKVLSDLVAAIAAIPR